MAEDALSILFLSYWEEDNLYMMFATILSEHFLEVVDREYFHILALEVFERHELTQKSLEDL